MSYFAGFPTTNFFGSTTGNLGRAIEATHSNTTQTNTFKLTAAEGQITSLHAKDVEISGNLYVTGTSNVPGFTFHDDANYNYVSSITSMAFDSTKQFNTLVGVDGGCIGGGDSEGTTILGSRARVQNGNSNIAIGANANILYTGSNPSHYMNGNITIGTNSYIQNPADDDQVKSNINLGHNNSLYNNSNNIVIGNAVNHGGQIANSIIIAQKPLTSPLPVGTEGSVIISSGGGSPSALPKLQFLGDGLTNLRGASAGNPVQVSSPAPFSMGNINGYMRVKYRNVNIMIPFILDDDLNPASNPV